MMPRESLEQFRLLVLEDATLQEHLRQTTDRETFIMLIIESGAERGFDFTAEEVREALYASRRAWLERWV
jgi:predicted ribosomally synthesized peptide with nif11-like leader